ncbi:type II toxin-antitoxin system HicA family toxin [Syntrophomonas wolfei]|uniref:type II toxin-antitoxin system HicA family toxin n=1 Tax=Syntrophomonas wolfei TaxID=863 RepID=UPI000774E243|nr:type II toxin-antitoxin system HicA family toxin [Syntrophomonas wolfei]
MNPKELMQILAQDGWKVVRIQGSHHIHKHPAKSGTIPVALHNKDMAPGTLNKILKIAGLK